MNRLRILCVLAVLLLVASGAMAMTAASDTSPLLFDRAATFPDIIVASLPEGFVKAVKPVQGANSVSLTVQVEKVLKGNIAPAGVYTIQCHQDLPALLAKRDANTPQRYLLVLQSGGNWGYLGAGNLHGDLARFIPADASVERVAAAFASAAKADASTQIKLCEGLLADAKLSSQAGRHINELLTRIAGAIACDDDPKAQTDRDCLAALVKIVIARAQKGLAVDSAAALLHAVKAWPKTPLKEYPASLAAPARKWLAAMMQEHDEIDPSQAQNVVDVVKLLAAMKDVESMDAIIRLARLEKAPAAAKAAIAALPAVLDKQAAEPLEELLKFYDRNGCEALYNAALSALDGLGLGKDRLHRLEKLYIE